MDRDLVLEHLPHVRALARRAFRGRPPNVELEDVISDGVVGLMQAASTFDASRGLKFWTFAEQRVRGAMVDGLRKQSWPRGVRRDRREIAEATEAHWSEHGEGPSAADLAGRVGRTEDWLRRRLAHIGAIESFRAGPSAYCDVESCERRDVSGEPVSRQESPDVTYARTQVARLVRRALPRRDQAVIGAYYAAGLTMREIAHALGICESRVCQLHARALQRLRRAIAA